MCSVKGWTGNRYESMCVLKMEETKKNIRKILVVEGGGTNLMGTRNFGTWRMVFGLVDFGVSFEKLLLSVKTPVLEGIKILVSFC